MEIELYSNPYVIGTLCIAIGVIAAAFLRRKPRAEVNAGSGDPEEVNNIGGA